MLFFYVRWFLFCLYLFFMLLAIPDMSFFVVPEKQGKHPLRPTPMSALEKHGKKCSLRYAPGKLHHGGYV